MISLFNVDLIEQINLHNLLQLKSQSPYGMRPNMSITELIQNLDAVAEPCSALAEADRVALLAACDRLKKRIETSMEATTRILLAV